MSNQQQKKKRAASEKIITPIGIVSFPHIYEPDSDGDYSDNKYKVTFLVPKNKEEDIKKLKMTALKVAREEWGEKVKFNELEFPLYDGDDKATTADEKAKKEGNAKKVGNWDAYKDHLYFTAKSYRQPGIVGPDSKPLPSGEDIKGGDFCRISISLVAYERPIVNVVDGKKKHTDQKGVTFRLENIQKVKTGKRFDGSSAPEDDFDPVDSSELLDDDLSSSDPFEEGDEAGF